MKKYASSQLSIYYWWCLIVVYFFISFEITTSAPRHLWNIFKKILSRGFDDCSLPFVHEQLPVYQLNTQCMSNNLYLKGGQKPQQGVRNSEKNKNRVSFFVFLDSPLFPSVLESNTLICDLMNWNMLDSPELCSIYTFVSDLFNLVECSKVHPGCSLYNQFHFFFKIE